MYILIFLIYYFLFFSKYVQQAIGSVKASCEIVPRLYSSNQMTDEKLKEMGVRGYYDSESGSINVLIEKSDEDYIKVLRHELCHYDQNLMGKNCDCSQKLCMFFQELDCYFKEYN